MIGYIWENQAINPNIFFLYWHKLSNKRISLTRRITNEEVIRIAGTKRSPFDTVEKRQLPFFGQVMRHDSLQRDLLEGMVEGKRGRGRPKLQWYDNITQWMASPSRRPIVLLKAGGDGGSWPATSISTQPGKVSNEN